MLRGFSHTVLKQTIHFSIFSFSSIQKQLAPKKQRKSTKQLAYFMPRRSGQEACTYPADVAGYSRLSLEPLGECHEQGVQTVLIDDGVGQHLADPPHGPGGRVAHHHAGVGQQVNQHGHGLLHQRLQLFKVRPLQDGACSQTHTQYLLLSIAGFQSPLKSP